MSCRKGKSTHERKSGHYFCRKCDAVVKKKDKACKAKKIK